MCAVCGVKIQDLALHAAFHSQQRLPDREPRTVKDLRAEQVCQALKLYLTGTPDEANAAWRTVMRFYGKWAEIT